MLIRLRENASAAIQLATTDDTIQLQRQVNGNWETVWVQSSSGLLNALQGCKVRAGTKQITFSDGAATLDLSSSGFTVMPTVICQITDNTSAAVITGCNPQSSTSAKIGARTVSDGALFNGTVWVRYIAVGA